MTHMTSTHTPEMPRASVAPQFWVVGGEYRDTGFDQLTGPAEALGPYADYDLAYKQWERRSLEMKRHAHVRYTIVCNSPR